MIKAKARLYWHIFVTEKTSAIIAEQLRFVERQPYPITAVIIWTENYEYLVSTIKDLIKSCKIIDCVKTDTAKEFEFDTLKTLYEEATAYEFVGYFHTKGAVMQSPNTHLWRNLMNFYTLQLAEATINKLEAEDHDFDGAIGTNGLSPQKPFIAGNFWWARSSYIRKLPFPSLMPHHTRYDCELWIGLADGKMNTYLDLGILASPITELAQKYDTDKKVHGYLPYYEMYLAAFRNCPGRLLEIGVNKGESLNLWKEALPHFVVEGLDLQEKPNLNTKVYVGSQSDRAFLATLPDYDIVIDDGGHRSTEQIISLVSKIQASRLYVIEDLHTSQPALYDQYHHPGEITCLDYLIQYPNLKPGYISTEEHERLKGRKIYVEQGVFSPVAFILNVVD